MIVQRADLPQGDEHDFLDTAFFAGGDRSLPSPEEVRQLSASQNDESPRPDRPPPAIFPDLKLLVKFGTSITIAEAQCLWFFNRHLKGLVPTPELYGWRTHSGQVFIYMELVQGVTLKEVWSELSEKDRHTILREVRSCVDTWRGLKQDQEPYFVGHIGGQGVGDIIFADVGDPNPGPFENITAFHEHFARLSCRRHPEWNPRRDFEELQGLTDNRPVVFTHADLDKSNILVTPPRDDDDNDDDPHLVAIIDWHQSGWYPADWEWLKAQWLCEGAEGGGRDSAWVSEMVDPADDEYFYGWDWSSLCVYHRFRGTIRASLPQLLPKEPKR